MARRESVSASTRSRETQPTASGAERSSFDPAGPLIDAEWLLGPARRPFLSQRMFLGLVTCSILCVAFIFSAPSWSRAWLRHQLADQFLNGTTPQLRQEGLIGLVGLLPESLPEVVAGFAKSNRRENESIYQALNEYLGELEGLPIETRRVKSAEVVYQLESALQIFSPEAMPLVESLTTLVQNVQVGDKHPAASVTLASCDRILKYRSEQAQEVALLPEIVASTKKTETSTGNQLVASTASLSDDTSSSVMKLSSFALSDSPGDAVQTQPPPPGLSLIKRDEKKTRQRRR